MRHRQTSSGAGQLAALAGAAALMLAVTLAACGEADNKKPSPQPDTTPNGSITTQPDTNGAVPGDDPERVDGSDASAAAETRMGRSAARRSRDAAAFDSDYQEMLHNGRVTDTDGFLDNDR